LSFVAGSNRLKALVTDLLAFSRVTTHGAELALTDAESWLREAIDNLELLIEESGARVT